MPYLFVGPTEKIFPVGQHRLFEFFERFDSGICLYRLNGVWYEDTFPAQDTLDLADIVYLGGHEYVVDNSTAAELTAAGYGEFLTEL